MNAVVQQTPSPGVGMIPTSMSDAMRLADMMSRGKLMPTHLRENPGDCLMVVELSMRLGMSPFAVAQCTSVISGKLMMEGKLVSAAVQASGVLSGRLHYDFFGEGAQRSVTISGTLRGETASRTLTVQLSEVKTTNQLWTKQPDQQLVYASTRVWARRFVPEVMLGVYTPEEFDAPASTAFAGTTIESEPEIQPAKIEPPKKPTAGQWLDALETEMKAAPDSAAVDAIAARDDVQRAMDKLQNGARDRLNKIMREAMQRTAAVNDDGDFPGEVTRDTSSEVDAMAANYGIENSRGG